MVFERFKSKRPPSQQDRPSSPTEVRPSTGRSETFRLQSLRRPKTIYGRQNRRETSNFDRDAEINRSVRIESSRSRLESINGRGTFSNALLGSTAIHRERVGSQSQRKLDRAKSTRRSRVKRLSVVSSVAHNKNVDTADEFERQRQLREPFLKDVPENGTPIHETAPPDYDTENTPYYPEYTYPEDNSEDEGSLIGDLEDDDQFDYADSSDTFSHIARKLMNLFLFGAVLVSAMFSKVCFAAIASKLFFTVSQEVRNVTELSFSTAFGESDNEVLRKDSITFVQLVIILMSPQAVTFIRMLFGGFIGKNSKFYPWPSKKALIAGFVAAILESTALCAFTFLVATHIGALPTILLLSGVYAFTGILGIGRCCGVYQNRIRSAFVRCMVRCFDNWFMNIFATMLQIGGILGAAGLVIYVEWDLLSTAGRNFTITNPIWLLIIRLCLATVLAPLLLSVIWSRAIMKITFSHSKFQPHDQSYSELDESDEQFLKEFAGGLPASRRGGLIYSFIRFAVIPFIAYGFARLAGIDVDPSLGFSGWTSEDLAVLLVQVLCSLATMFLSLVALWSTLQRFGFTLPLLLSTPAAVGWYWIAQIDGTNLFPFYRETNADFYIPFYGTTYLMVSIALAVLWISQVIILGAGIWYKPKHALGRERTLLVSPHYDGVFLDSTLLLNRHSSEYFKSTFEFFDTTLHGTKPAVFICSTMYHEAEHEMRQMLKSIYRVAENLNALYEYEGNIQLNDEEDGGNHYSFHDSRRPHFESHVFFDGAALKNQVNEYVLQLMSLLEDTLHVKVDKVKKFKTPYGYQMKWNIGVLPFYIHLKDNTKVKNKKRWSQVMYMNYIINYRMKERNEQGHLKFDPQTSYILTTDADIDFKADAVAALLDFLARDDTVGAVCARTHPLGSGPIAWYQTFEYAFGHWFQKSAEHVLGCVLCCPGCFSAFRVRALADVLETYSSQVTSAAEFLTKDMGEDRWLCTLLIQKGWRLEYSALSENSTYAPESFDEFFNQRRRWVPSTVANLMELIANSKTIARNNDSISFLFIMYEMMIIISTAVSPATIILVVASGLFSAYQFDRDIVVGVLSAVSVLYGFICIYTPERIQLGVAKLLTLIFTLLMTAAFTGIFASTFDFLRPEFNVTENGTVEIPIGTRFLESLSVDGVYLWGFAGIVIITGILHWTEFRVLLHFIWYILAIPSAYLLLLIYSAANLNNRSWGTRVGAAEKKKTSQGTKYDEFVAKMKSCWSSAITPCIACIKRKLSRRINGDPEPQPAEVEEEKEIPKPSIEKKPSVSIANVEHPAMEDKVINWLKGQECDDFLKTFEENGYTHMDFIFGMTSTDLNEIGITKKGFVQRLLIAIKTIPTPTCLGRKEIPKDVADFLYPLNLSQYLPLFKAEGFSLKQDVAHLPSLSRDDLQSMGITKRAHLNMMVKALKALHDPTSREIKIINTKSSIDVKEEGELDIAEEKFWKRIVDNILKPSSIQNDSNTDDLKEKLGELRTNTLVAMAIVNLIWLILLLTLDLQFLEGLGIDQSLLPLAFAVLYFGILLIQLLALLAHRLETLIHVVARTNIDDS